MGKVASILRKNVPRVYGFLVDIKLRVKRWLTPHRIYITDSLGGSFKDYFLTRDMPSRIHALERGLDPDSLRTVRVILERLKHYPDERFKRAVSRSAPVIGGLLDVETPGRKKEIHEHLQSLSKSIRLPSSMMEESVFHYAHGLSLLPEKALEYIRGRDFIDAGAYIGDSAIALWTYNYRKIYSIEMSRRSIDKYLKNVTANGIPTSKYEILNFGITGQPTTDPVHLPDTGSAGFSIFRDQGKYDRIAIEQRTLDQLVQEYTIEPRFIKVDIEGYALELIKGAQDTLKRYRPVLSVAIYHNPYEFFEAKPILEDILPGYNFMIRKLCTGLKNNLAHSEVVLLAWPGELS